MQSVKVNFAFCAMPYRLSAPSRSLQHKFLCIQHRELSTITPFTSIVPGLLVTFMRDFLRVSLEVKTVCTSSGLRALLFFWLMPLMYGWNTLTLGWPLRHPSRLSSVSSRLLASGTRRPWKPFGHAYLHLLGQVPVDISIWLCDRGSLQFQTSPLDSSVSCSGGSGLCGWVSCTRWWSVCFYTFSHECLGRESILWSPPSWIRFLHTDHSDAQETVQLPVTTFQMTKVSST